MKHAYAAKLRTVATSDMRVLLPEPIPQSDVRDEEAAEEASRLRSFFDRNFGLFLVFCSQTCSSIMNTAAKLLATGYEPKFHALQIIFIRMLATSVIGMLYMWYHQIPDFPLGAKGIRKLLVLRGSAGFTGLFGLYYSLSYLDFADATVITFIIPTLTAFVCFVWLREPFTMQEAMAGVLAFTGVLFVARPAWLFLGADSGSSGADDGRGLMPKVPVSPVQRSIATCVAIMGTFGASTAYATIRVIGKRAHSLISVNYFATVATIGSGLIIWVHPDLQFVMPHGVTQWVLIAIIGLAGFLLQFLLTEGLQREKAGRATNLVYMQLVFALIIERVIWGTVPPAQSLFGAALIIGAAIWVSLQKNAIKKQKGKALDEERRPLLERREDEATD